MPESTAKPMAWLQRCKLFAHMVLNLAPRDALAFVWDELRGHSRERWVRVRGFHVLARTHSSDFRVILDTFCRGEYRYLRGQSPKVVVDAGANIGTSALAFADMFPGATIYALEMDPENFRILRENVRHLSRIVPLHVALASSDEPRPLIDRHTGSWGFTLVDSAGEATGLLVPCVSMATLCERYGIERIGLLKLDIEGGEKDILGQSAAWIERVDILTAELHDRICPGCEEAFALATRDFGKVGGSGEKRTAYRADADKA